MYHLPEVNINEYDYDLPEEKIAQHPLEQRDASRLLIWKDGILSDDVFMELHNHLPSDCLMIFNDTKVIKARLMFRKPTGGWIEIFCLEPAGSTEDPERSMQETGSVLWKCLVGNAKRWKSGRIFREIIHSSGKIQVAAELKKRLEDGCFEIGFSWQPENLTFREILDQAGAVPLPPYIQRPSGREDSIHYQTIYASHEGSVAAPTAGLHFTGDVLETLHKKNIQTSKVTLHVGLGTFRPVSGNDVSGHIMHKEKISVGLDTISALLKHTGKPVIAVGTTSVRTIESLYWIGVKLITNPGKGMQGISQWDPYDAVYDHHIPVETALQRLAEELAGSGSDHYQGTTQLMILPGYRYRILSGMITNFHLPKSTLLLLVSAFAGKDWKKAYEYALAGGFRFLSYGDASLFMKTKI